MKKIAIDPATLGRIDIFHGSQTGLNDLNAF
jgi:hypothetical protein